jgi:putative oxidoreductase
MFKRLFLLKPIPLNQDLALLALRLMAVSALLLKHGLEKTIGFNQLLAHPIDPIGIGGLPTLMFAALSDGICTVLIILGVATRWSALICFINIFAAWAFVHHFIFWGHEGDHGEMIVLYLAVMVTLFFAGPGKYSIDRMLIDKEG